MTLPELDARTTVVLPSPIPTRSAATMNRRMLLEARNLGMGIVMVGCGCGLTRAALQLRDAVSTRRHPMELREL
ncbi:MAG: hypothetical protein AMXMBFR23_18830 [Chloroflexota bacterium]